MLLTPYLTRLFTLFSTFFTLFSTLFHFLKFFRMLTTWTIFHIFQSNTQPPVLILLNLELFKNWFYFLLISFNTRSRFNRYTISFSKSLLTHFFCIHAKCYLPLIWPDFLPYFLPYLIFWSFLKVENYIEKMSI